MAPTCSMRLTAATAAQSACPNTWPSTGARLASASAAALLWFAAAACALNANPWSNHVLGCYMTMLPGSCAPDLVPCYGLQAAALLMPGLQAALQPC